jgi:type VI secretion system protein ImpH
MARTIRTQADNLIETLADCPEAFDFFQALRLLQRYWKDSPRIGYATHPGNEPLQLRQNPTLAFTGALIHSFRPATIDKPANMALNHHGLIGPNGPLPVVYTEFILDRIRSKKDHSIINFLDIFHHRLMSLLFRAWADSNIAVAFDRSVQDGHLQFEFNDPAINENQFFEHAGSLVGIGLPMLRGRDNLPESVRIYHAPWLTRQVRSAEGLEKIISDFLDVPATVIPFQGRWLPLPPDSWALLGESTETGMLGENCFLSEIIWDCTSSFRIKVGPVSHAELLHLIPGTDSFERLRALIRTYVGYEFYWDLEIAVKARTIPLGKLGEKGRIGLDAWAGETDSDDEYYSMIFDPEFYKFPQNIN